MIYPGKSGLDIHSQPLVSVVITCYNQGEFLSKSIETALQQTYSPLEVIVIDDGSTDQTAYITKSYKGVQYYYQENKGLPAARNRGINESSGRYILFLDADDWLFPESIAAGVKVLESETKAAFISGAFKWINLYGEIGISNPVVSNDYYLALLEKNYIGMHGAVLYRREIVLENNFDTSLKAFEDYDMYLQISKKYPILHQDIYMAMYRKHENNMSYNNTMMLNELQKVLKKHTPEKNNPAAFTSWRKGTEYWEQFFLLKLIQEKNTTRLSYNYIRIILKNPTFVFRIFKRHYIIGVKTFLKSIIPESILSYISKNRRAHKNTPSPGHVRPGDFKRLIPFDNQFGFNRGRPVDRIYIEQFLSSESSHIKGRVLEIGDNSYTLRFGRENVQKSDILHVDQTNPVATFTGDLCNAPQLPDGAFDCVILTQTLHLIYEFKDALRTCKRILKPGGALLLTVPGITPIDKGEWSNNWFWSFTQQSIKRVSTEIFNADLIETNAYGNVFSATAFLYGMAASELTNEELFFIDPQFPVIVTLKVVVNERPSEK